MRWRRKDGTTGLLTADKDSDWISTLGWTERPDGKHVSFADCGAGRITFDGAPGQLMMAAALLKELGASAGDETVESYLHRCRIAVVE